LLALLQPEHMSKIAILGLKKHREKIVTILQEMNTIQIEPLSKDAVPYLSTEKESMIHKKISEQLLRIRGLINALPHSNHISKAQFNTLDDLFESLEGIKIDDDISSLEHKKEKLLTESKEIENNIKLLEEYSFFPDDLELLHLRSTLSFFGKVKTENYQELKKKLESNNQDIILYSKNDPKITRFVLVVLPHFPSNALASIVNLFNVHLEAVPKLSGKVSDALTDQRAKLQEISRNIQDLDNKLTLISREYYSILKGLEEQLEIENKKLEVIDDLGVTTDSFSLEGWIPTNRIPMTRESFNKHTEGTLLFVMKTDEVPPTLQKNPKRSRVYESFVRFYSIPQGNEFDPTVIFAIVFPVFYGMMLGDFGYGLVIFLVSLWVIRRIEKGKKNFTIAPKFFRNFGKTILYPSQMVKIAKAIIPGCIIAMILGFSYDLYFGFRLNELVFFPFLNSIGINAPVEGSLLLDPLSSDGLRKLLLVSGYIGLGMATLGLLLGLVNSIRARNRKHAIGKAGWLLVGWGIVLIGLALIGKQNLDPMSNMNALVYFVILFAGIGLLFVGEGVRSLMELPSIISHILSFTRIIGILMASVILADVIDYVFLRVIDNGFVWAIIGIVILVVGHLSNTILGVFEPGIQASRLMYVEFFSKFYHGSGKVFKPFGIRRKYTQYQYQSPPTTK
jgi:V/A-type H+/Na+-transporting ATPase subunit I